jgi:hypothetical protein
MDDNDLLLSFLVGSSCCFFYSLLASLYYHVLSDRLLLSEELGHISEVLAII